MHGVRRGKCCANVGGAWVAIGTEGGSSRPSFLLFFQEQQQQSLHRTHSREHPTRLAVHQPAPSFPKRYSFGAMLVGSGREPAAVGATLGAIVGAGCPMCVYLTAPIRIYIKLAWRDYDSSSLRALLLGPGKSDGVRDRKLPRVGRWYR